MFRKCKYDVNMFRIAKEINATDAITKIIAFQPPKKCQYKLRPFNEKGSCFISKSKHCCRYEKVIFIHDEYEKVPYKWIEQECYTFKIGNEISKNKDKNIVILHLKNTNKPKGGYTILLSHGNSSTLGTIYPTLIDICTQLKCDILAYDYSGYGKSEGKKSEQEIYINIEEVGFFAMEILNIPAKEMILLGHSLGSAPSIHMAIQKSFKEVKAVILISPIASGVKLVSPGICVKDLEKIDVFCNINKINDISCPIFVIHGEKDEVIPISHSKEMVKYMKIPYEWHPRHGDHLNILTRYRSKFFQKCKFFFEFLNHNEARNTDAEPIPTPNDENVYQERINKYTNYFNNHNQEELTKSKVEESYIYFQKIPNGNFSIANKETIDEFEDRMRFSKFNSIYSTNVMENPNSFNGINPFEYPSLEPNKFPYIKNRTPNPENSDGRVSDESNMIAYKHDKALEDQYNKIIFKHKET